MITLFLLVVLLAVALGIVGAVVHGLFYLLIIAIVLFVLDLALAGRLMNAARRHRPAR